MIIDARTLTLHELFIKLREIFSSQCGAEVMIEIQVSTSPDSKKIKAFASMSGCRAEVKNMGDYYLVKISGTPCCT